MPPSGPNDARSSRPGRLDAPAGGARGRARAGRGAGVRAVPAPPPTKVADLGATLDEARTPLGAGTSGETLSPRPLTPEEVVDRHVPADPQFAPDGSSLLFTVAPGGRVGEHKDQALWVARDGAAARPFTAGTAHDANPRWSPDGRHVLFTSDRAERGEHRLYLLAMDGGEARPLGDLHGALAGPAWSPDGTAVAVLRRDPETAEEKRRREERDDPIVADESPKPQRLWVVDVTTGHARCLTYGPRQVWSFAWGPDSDQLAIVTTPNPEGDTAYGPGDLWLVPAAGGTPRRVAGFPSLPADPTFVTLPGGPAIALRANAHRSDPSDSVWAVPLPGGEPRNLLPDYPGVVEALVPLPGRPDAVAVRLVEGTHGLLYRLDLAEGTLMPLTGAAFHGRGSAGAGPSLSAGGSRVAVVWSDGRTPEEVLVGEVSGVPRAVTAFGTPFHGRLGHVETVRWPSHDGLEIEGLLVLPPGHRAGDRHPLVVDIHGGPSWQWEERVQLSWHDWAQFLGTHGYAVLLPNPRGSTGYGSAFQKRIQDDVGGGEADDIVSGAEAMVARGVADPDRLGIGGWSWGGYLTAQVTTRTGMFKAAVMGAGLANVISDHGTDDIPTYNTWLYPGQPYDHMTHYWERSPIRLARNVTTPALILHGDADVRVHPGQGMEWYRALKTLGVPNQFVRYPREGHGIQERLHQLDLLRRVLAWYDRWLKPDQIRTSR